jgi:hypothetical protein
LRDGLRQLQGLPVPEVAAEARQFEKALETRGVQTHYLAAAAGYDRHGWLLNAEANRAWARKESAINFNSGYISVGRRFGAWSAFVMESAALRDQDVATAPDWATVLAPVDPVLAQQAQALGAGAALAVNKSSAHQFTTSAGVRWDVTPRLALKAQIDRVRTRRDGDGLWLSADGRPATTHVFALAADFVF